jgi:hypothetical protein
MSTGFLLLFIAFGTAQGLASKILLDAHFGSLGFYSLGVLYVVFGCSSFLAAPLVTFLGDKWSLTLGALCYTTYVGATILPLEM